MLQRIAASWSASRWYWIAAIAIMALTLWLRLWRLDLIQFKDDQGTLLRLAEDIVRLGRVPLAGMTSSIGIPVAPTFEYLLAPVVAVSRDPRVSTAAIGLVNAAAVAGTMRFGWRRFSPLTGVVAGLVFATNLWAVFFARKIWSNDVMAPTAVVLLFCLDNAVIGEQVAWGVAAFPVFALGVEFHPSFVLLAPLVVVLGAIMLRRGHRKHVAAGVGLAALTAVPYLIYTLQTQWSYVQALASPSGAEAPVIDAQGPGDVIGLIGGWRAWDVEGLDINVLLPLHLAEVPGPVETLLLAIGVAAAAIFVFRSPQIGQRVRFGGLLLWVVVPMLLTIPRTIPLYNYYFLFVLPAGALLIGLGVHTLFHSPRAGRAVGGAALAGVLGVAVLQSVIVVRELGYLADGYVLTYGPPLRTAEQTTGELIDVAKRTGVRQLSVEIDDVNDVAIGYLARPYIPEVQVVARRRGPWDVNFDLPGPPSVNPPYAFAGPPRLSVPTAINVSYADGVRVLSASTTRSVTPGESVGLALTWTLQQHPANPLTNRLVWELSVYEPSGHEVRRVAGMAHDWAEMADGEVALSWITAALGADSATGVYQVHVDRLDPISREPIPAIGADAEWSAGTLEVRRGS